SDKTRDMLSRDLIQVEARQLGVRLQIRNTILVEPHGIRLGCLGRPYEGQEVVFQKPSRVGTGFLSRMPTSPLANAVLCAASTRATSAEHEFGTARMCFSLPAAVATANVALCWRRWNMREPVCPGTIRGPPRCFASRAGKGGRGDAEGS